MVQPFADAGARHFGQVHKVDAYFFSSVVAPGDAGGSLEALSGFSHFELDQQDLAFRFRPDDVQSSAVLADVVEDAFTVGAVQDDIQARRDRAALVDAAVRVFLLLNAADVVAG